MNRNKLLNHARKIWTSIMLVVLMVSAFGAPNPAQALVCDTTNCPDLNATVSVEMPENSTDPIYINDDFTITIATKNLNSTPSDPFTVNVCVLPAPSASTCNGTRDYHFDVAALAASSPINSGIMFRAGNKSVGDYVVVINIDSANAVAESDETNNVISQPFTINALAGSSPTNDNFSGATPITDPAAYSAPVDVSFATRELNEPAPSFCPTDGLDPGMSSVWYQYTPASNANLFFDTIDSSYDTYLAVWRGSSIDTLTLVGCNDDIETNNKDSDLLANLTSGTTYYIQIAQYSQNKTTTEIVPNFIAPAAKASQLDGLGFSASPISSSPALADGDLQFHINYGRVISGNVGMAGVSVGYSINGVAQSVISDANGNYKLFVPSGWGGVVTPTKVSYVFSPASRDYSVPLVTADQLNQNFITKPIFASNAAQDGWTLESSEFSNKGGTMNSGSGTFALGDNALRKQYRSILSFNTASLPDNATVTSVTLKIRRSGLPIGGASLSMFGGFMVDVRKGFFGTAALTPSDFQVLAQKTIGPYSPAFAGGGYSINMTAAKAYINKLGATQIRLRFRIDDNNNAIANYINFFSGNATTAGYRPQLIVQYSIP